MSTACSRPVEILLVEDSPTDIGLIAEAFEKAAMANHLNVIEDGLEALAFLRRQGKHHAAPRPDLILLDLKLPSMSGHEVLATIKAEEKLKSIPVVVLAGSPAEPDVLRSYHLHASCHITKPADFAELARIVDWIASFWLSSAVLPLYESPHQSSEA